MNKHDFKIKGYIIKVRYHYYKGNQDEDAWTNWNIHFNNKLYTSKVTAEEALKYTKEFLGKAETRIKPLYEINYERNK